MNSLRVITALQYCCVFETCTYIGVWRVTRHCQPRLSNSRTSCLCAQCLTEFQYIINNVVALNGSSRLRNYEFKIIINVHVHASRTDVRHFHSSVRLARCQYKRRAQTNVTTTSDDRTVISAVSDSDEVFWRHVFHAASFVKSWAPHLPPPSPVTNMALIATCVLQMLRGAVSKTRY